MYLSVYPSIHPSMHACIHGWMYVCMHGCMYVCTYVRMYAWLHACILAILLLLEINQSWELRKIWILASSVVTSSEVKSLEATKMVMTGELCSRVLWPPSPSPSHQTSRRKGNGTSFVELTCYPPGKVLARAFQPLSARLLDWIVKDEVVPLDN